MSVCLFFIFIVNQDTIVRRIILKHNIIQEATSSTIQNMSYFDLIVMNDLSYPSCKVTSVVLWKIPVWNKNKWCVKVFADETEEGCRN